MNLKEKILKNLATIQDPDLKQDIVSLGFIKDLSITPSDGGKQAVSFKIELTTPACPVKEEFKQSAEKLVNAIDEVTHTEVTITAQKQNRQPQFNQQDHGLTQVNSIVSIASCKGGVGKSTLSATIACETVARGFKVGLLDLDIFGPSLPTLFNLQHTEGVQSKNKKLIPLEIPVKGANHSSNLLKLMSFGFLLGDSPAVMRGAMVSNYITQLLFNVDWGDLDYLFIDLPPGTGDTQLTVSQSIPLDGSVIVTTNQSLSLVDVARGILMFEKVSVPILGLIENMAYFECGKCNEKHYPFGNSSQALKERFGITSIAQLPFLAAEQMDFTNYQTFSIAQDLVDNLMRALGSQKKITHQAPKVGWQEGVIHLDWGEKKLEVSSHALRTQCGCALCKNEVTGERLLDPSTVSPNIAPTEITPLGNYALSIHWNDGHTSGIYSYTLIESIVKNKNSP